MENLPLILGIALVMLLLGLLFGYLYARYVAPPIIYDIRITNPPPPKKTGHPVSTALTISGDTTPALASGQTVYVMVFEVTGPIEGGEEPKTGLPMQKKIELVSELYIITPTAAGSSSTWTKTIAGINFPHANSLYEVSAFRSDYRASTSIDVETGP